MENATQFLPNILLGLETALVPTNLFYCFLGVVFGMFIGVLPGIGAMTAISLLFPITIYLEPTAALIMLAGIHYGASYGGHVASILLNLPGTTSSAVVTLDGYPMAQNGKAGVALMATTVASFLGGSIAIVGMMLLAPLVAGVALDIGPSDYFALMVLGLVAASTISTGSALKGVAMMLVGLAIGLIGIDPNTATNRFTFGILRLSDGISLVVLAMGLFGIAEVIANARVKPGDNTNPIRVSFKSMFLSREEVRQSVKPVFRGSAIGFFCGILPGLGGLIASYMAYAAEKRSSKTPERFGKGAIEGIVGPEASNNSADQASFIPTMTLGIPGSANLALMLSMLMIHGITPGPTIITNHPNLFWGLIMSFWIGNLILLILNIPLIGIWVRILSIPRVYLIPAIVTLVCFGVYSVGNDPFHVWLVLVFGVVGYGMRLLNLPAATLLLGYVLGPLLETNFKNALILARGDIVTVVSRPVSGTVLFIAALLLIWGIWSAVRSSRAVSDKSLTTNQTQN